MNTQLDNNKAVTRRVLEEVISQGRFDLIEEFNSPDFVTYAPDLPEEGLQGPSGYRRWLEGLRASFPDIKISVEDQIAEGDKVVCRVAQGTHAAAFEGIPPLGKTFNIGGIVIYQLRDRKLIRYWLEQDSLSLVRQWTE